MPTSSPMKKTIELQANASTPHGATIKLTVEYRIRPPTSPTSGPIYEGVKIHQHVDADLGAKGRYEQRANYTYENEDDRSPKYTPFERPISPEQADLSMTEKIIEHVSEDEKSTSSEEVIFEEWTEEFSCRRTDEIDRRTNQILRTTIDETSDRIKGDVIKEHYKEKNTRIKGRKSYDVVREIPRRTPQRIYEELPPPSTSSIIPRSSSSNRQWTSEDIYTTEIVQDPRIARELESTAHRFNSTTHYDRVRPSEPSPPPPPSTSRYDRISTVVTTPSTHYTDIRKPETEDVVTEEYQVEIQSPTKSGRTSDWRSEMKQIYTPTSDDDQHRSTSDGNYLAQRVSVIPSTTQSRVKEVQIRLPGQDKTPPERRKFDPSPPTSRHMMKEVLVCLPRGSSTKENEQERKRTGLTDTESPTYSRVGQLRNTFETSSTTTGSPKDDYRTSPRSANERRLSETHTAPSLVSDRISRFENLQSIDSYDRKGFETTVTSKQVISSIDSDMSAPAQPIYQSTPKSFKQQAQDDDAGHESEDELSDPKQYFDSRRRSSKTRLRDFSQSTSPPDDATHTVQRTTTHFDETHMENVLSHVPTSKGKGMLIELSPSSIGKSHLTSDSGVFDYSTTPTTHQGRMSDVDQTTLQNVDDSLSRSTYRYDRENFTSQQYPQSQQRTVRRHLTNSPPTEYEELTNYQSRIDTQGRIPITTQSRSIKPLVVDAYETFETETQVECEVQRTNEMKESTTTTTERMASPLSPSRKILTTTTTQSSIETTPARRVLLNERPQYYESPKDEQRFQPIQRDHSQDELPYRPSSTSHTHTMEVTTLSPSTHVTFEKSTPTEIIAVVRVPELSTPTARSNTTNDRLHYQRVHAGSYRPSPTVLPSSTGSTYQQRSSRSRNGPSEHTSNYSSPINIPIRSVSSHSNLHEQNQQRYQQPISPRPPQTRYHSGSLSNLYGSNLEFEIEIEKRPPHKPEQPTSVSLDQPSRAVVTTSKDGRVSVHNIAAYPGNTVVINSDFHASDRSLNRSSGYFSSDEPRSQGHTTNYSSDEQSSSYRRVKPNENTARYHFNPSTERSPHKFHETIDQIDALYNNLEVQNNGQRQYDFSRMNRRRQMTPNAADYSNRYTSTGFEQTPSHEQQASAAQHNTFTPTRPSVSLSSSGILADYGSPNSTYGTASNPIVQQNRWNAQSQIVQRNRTSVKQMKQKSAAKRRTGNAQGSYSDEDDENESPRYYSSNNQHYQ